MHFYIWAEKTNEKPKGSPITWILMLLLLVAAACAPKQEEQTSCNFVRNSTLQRVSWKGQAPMNLSIHVSVPAEYQNSIRLAAQEWEHSMGRTLFNFQGSTTSENPADNEVIVYWNTDWDEAKPKEQARTVIQWRGNQIYKASVHINAKNFQFFVGDISIYNQVDFQSLVTHELGHSLGLDHITSEKSVMAIELPYGALRRTPEKIDVTSLKCEY